MLQAKTPTQTPTQNNSTSELLTQLVQDRDDLVTNLTTKGITGLTGDETFTKLVPEVLNIPSGSGHDWSALGYSGEPQVIQDGYDYAVQVKNNWNPNLTNYSRKFVNDLKLMFMPMVNTSSGIDFGSMFSGCSILTTIPQLDTSSGKYFNGMFSGCSVLTTIPQLDTSSGTNFSTMFFSCKNLTTIPQLDLSSSTNVDSMLYYCVSLTNVGGFKDLGKAYLTTASANNPSYQLNLSSSNNLTHDSLMNVINNLYDIASAGVQTQKLVLGSTNLAKLSADEIAIATNKGWAVS